MTTLYKKVGRRYKPVAEHEEWDSYPVARLADIPPGQVTSAIRTTEIAWEIEKLQRGEAA